MSSLKNPFARRKNLKTQTLTKRLRVMTLTKMCDNLEEYSTSSPLETVPDITEFTDISLKESALNLPEVSPIVKESIIVLSKNLPDKLLLMRDIQHAIKLSPGDNLPDLPHFRLNPTKQIVLKWQVDKLSLEVNQSCIVPINIHFYEDKFWNNIVTKR